MAFFSLGLAAINFSQTPFFLRMLFTVSVGCAPLCSHSIASVSSKLTFLLIGSTLPSNAMYFPSRFDRESTTIIR
ncbi:unnamed protein product [Mycoplasma amphoriforme A39]|uniref:Uncharacterized protein n=1 Tax=Mycoplasma amphoriforme A39 TaxID=572419 RepID=A0A292IIR3_9MOLU|nr:unnamed protein product [Mycoplasma amphoriforme A39]